MTINFQAIGNIVTPYTSNAPYQPVAADDKVFKIVVNPEYTKALRTLEKFSHIYVIYYIDKAAPPKSMTIAPSWLQQNDFMMSVGLFASRAPQRPNPIGLSVVQIKKIEQNTIFISGIDAFNNTPVLDIKPYIKDLDAKTEANNGWLDELEDADHLLLHIKGVPHDY